MLVLVEFGVEGGTIHTTLFDVGNIGIARSQFKNLVWDKAEMPSLADRLIAVSSLDGAAKIEVDCGKVVWSRFSELPDQ
jgi:hypothetical protein